MLRLSLLAVALLLSVSAVAVTMWIVAPAPIYQLFLVAVGGSEWSLWFGILAVLGVACGVAALRYVTHPWVAWAAIGLGVLGVVFALVPPVEAQRAARATGVSLSLRRYLFGWNNRPAPISPQTVNYATVDGQALQLDVYRAPSNEARPAVIVVHGGSWSGGRRSELPVWNAWFVQHGYVVFDIEYRLGPQPNWQTATGDVKCAIGWVKRNAAQYGVDPERIALLGRSAGAHLALLAAYTPTEPALLPSCDTPDGRVQAVIGLYAPTDLVWGYEHPTNPTLFDSSGILRRFLGGDPQTAADAYRIAAPINHVGAQTPPTLLLHGGRDQLVSDYHMQRLEQVLKAAQVPHQAVNIPYGQHGFDFNFDGWGSQIEQDVALKFLQTYLAR